jgi:4-amino-4-deoxy-L-arabinose transferase-like glycosyltransferase
MINYLRRKYDVLALILLIALVLVLNIAWLAYDTRPTPIRGDEIILFNKTLTFIDTIRRDESAHIFSQMSNLILRMSYGNRPPLYQLLSVPFIMAFGRSMDAGVYVNLVFEVILMIAIFNIGRIIKDSRLGLLATLIVVAYPPIIVCVRLYRPLFALAACVSLVIWFLLLLYKTRSVAFAWAANLTMAFGIYLHPTFIWGVILPVALFYIYIVFIDTGSKETFSFVKLPAQLIENLRQPLFLTGLLPSGILAIGLVLYWYIYLTNGYGMYADLFSTRGTASIFLGFEMIHYPPFLAYLLTSPQAISSVMAAFLGIGFVTALFKRQFTVFLIGLAFVFSYFILSAQVTLGWRYFAQIIPLGALLTAYWVTDIRHRLTAWIITTIVIGVSVINYAVVSLGVNDIFKPIVLAMGGSINWCEPIFALYCPDPPAQENWHQEEILQIVLGDGEKCKRQICTIMVSSQNPFFGVYTFTYYLTTDFPKSRLRFLNEGWGFVFGTRRGYAFTTLLESDYIVYQDVADFKIYSDKYAFYNSNYPYYDNYVDVTVRIIQSRPPIFSSAHQEIARFTMPDGTTAVLLKRTKPLTSMEAVEVIATAKFQGTNSISEYEVLIPLIENDPNQVQQLCQDAFTRYGSEKVEKNKILSKYCEK